MDRRELAETLRLLRERAGMSLEEAAHLALDASAAKLSRIETERQVAVPRDVRDLCRLYGADKKQVERLVRLATTGRRRGYWEDFALSQDAFVGFEAGATEIWQFETYVVPSLLQTPAYADSCVRAFSRGRPERWTESERQEFLKLRNRRAELTRPDSGVSFQYVIDESALLRPVGTAAEFREQLDHLAEVSTQPNVSIQILLLEAGLTPGQFGAFTILTLPGESSDLVYLENYSRSVFVDDPVELRRYRDLFALLRTSGLDDASSRARFGI